MENIIEKQYRYQHNQAKPKERKISKSGSYDDYQKECQKVRMNPEWSVMVKEMRIRQLAIDYGFEEPTSTAQWSGI